MYQYRRANSAATGGWTDANKVGYLAELLRSNIEHLTGNPDSMDVECFVDTHEGPVLLEVSSALPGLIDDMWQKPVIPDEQHPLHVLLSWLHQAQRGGGQPAISWPSAHQTLGARHPSSG